MPNIRTYKRFSTILKIASIFGIIIIASLIYDWSEQKLLLIDPVSDPVLSNPLQNSPSSVNQPNTTEPQQNYQVHIDNSFFEGVSHDLKPYQIIANSVIKLSEDQYRMHQIDGVYQMGKDNLFLNAHHGVIDNYHKLIELEDDVQIAWDYFLLSSNKMQIDLNNKDVSSNVRTKMLYKNSEVKADSFNSNNNGKIIKFKGNVKTILDISDF